MSVYDYPRMPTISFSDRATYETLLMFIPDQDWTVRVVLKGDLHYDISLNLSMCPKDDNEYIGGYVWGDDEFNGPFIYFPIEDIKEIIVH